MEPYSKRVEDHTSPEILLYLQGIATALLNNDAPSVLSTGEQLGCDHFVISLEYFNPELSYESRHSNCKYVWYREIFNGKTLKYFDWANNHDLRLDICRPSITEY